MAFDITPYIDKKPSEVRELIRQGVIDFPTAGMCRGYAQANLVILPPEYAPETHAMGEGGNIVTDIPRYRVYENGVFTKELTDASEYWKDGYVGFLIGCSFSFEEALMAAGIPVRHIEMGCNVPMYKTNIQTVKAGPFEGPMVCSMRPMTPEQAQVAYDITVKMPNVHGAPVQIGDPEKVGVLDVMKPDYGDPVEIREGEVPVFWPCGVTPQAAVGKRQAPHRHHPRPRPHVHHRHSQHRAQRLSGGSEAQIKFLSPFHIRTRTRRGGAGSPPFLGRKGGKRTFCETAFRLCVLRDRFRTCLFLLNSSAGRSEADERRAALRTGARGGCAGLPS